MPGHLYRRGGTWWGRVTLAGREYRRSLRTPDRGEARRRVEAWIEDLNRAAYFGGARRTYKETVVRWSEEAGQSIRPSTLTRYLVSVRQLDPHFGGLFLDQIDRRSIADFVAARRRLRATNATIRRDLTALSRILASAIAWGWMDENPARAYDRSTIREKREPMRPPGDDEVAQLVAICPPAFGRLVLFLRHTGMRQQEAATLTWAQVDSRRREATLYVTKRGRPRVVPLSDEAWAQISAQPRHLNSPWVFWHGAGDPYRQVASRFARLVKAAKLDFRCHDLRHKFAVETLKAGGDIYRLSKILGHASVKTTEIYLAYAGPGPAQIPAQVQRSGATAAAVTGA